MLRVNIIWPAWRQRGRPWITSRAAKRTRKVPPQRALVPIQREGIRVVPAELCVDRVDKWGRQFNTRRVHRLLGLAGYRYGNGARAETTLPSPQAAVALPWGRVQSLAVVRGLARRACSGVAPNHARW
jgi:hypothetical protein